MPEHLDRVRTPLLTLITLESLDEDYQVASQRRRLGKAAAERRTPKGAGVLVALVLFGLLVTVAAVQTSREAGVDDASRESLIQRIESRRKDVAHAEQDLSDLRASNSDDETALTDLDTQVNAAEARTSGYGALTGFHAVTGPAVRVTLDSAPYADQNDQVRDSDIALLVDALWGVGAEAITVNGQRVTARTGIRTSGDAIEVNGVGVAPPYTILAIGDTDQMSADFLDSASGQAFVFLADQYDFSYDIHDVGQVRMASAPAQLARLRSASAVGAGGQGKARKGAHKRGGHR